DLTAEQDTPNHDLHFQGYHKGIDLKKSCSLDRIFLQERKRVRRLAEAMLIFPRKLLKFFADPIQVPGQVITPVAENPSTACFLDRVLQCKGAGLVHAASCTPGPTIPERNVVRRSSMNLF